MRSLFGIAWLICCVAMVGCTCPKRASEAAPLAAKPIDVVFVCQYGYGKSLVAAKYFERLAAARGLSVRVIARGATPKSEVPPALESALRQDGFEVAGYRPVALEARDLEGAEYVFTFAVDVPFESAAETIRWDDVSALSENYAKSRDEIVAHLEKMLAQIERDVRKP